MNQTFSKLRKGLMCCLVAISALPSQAAYRDVVLADSPYRYWTFDSSDDQQIFDQVAGGPETRLQVGSGAMLVNHLDLLSGLALGKTLAPSGGADYSSVYNGALDPVGTNITGSYVLELWFKSTRDNQPETALLMLGMNTNHPSLVYDPADHTVRLIAGSNSSGRVAVGGDSLGWHHVVIGVLQDGSSNVTQMRARIDGVAKTMTIGAYNSDVDFGAPGSWPNTFFGVHGLATVGDKQFFGYVDEIAVYDLGAGVDATALDTKMTALAAHYAAATVAPEFAVVGNPELGVVPTDLVTTRGLSVINNGAAPITLNSVTLIGGDAASFAVDSFPTTLGAGQRGSIVLAITPGPAAIDLATTLTVQSTAANPTVTADVKAKAIEAPSEYAAAVLQSGPTVYYPLDPSTFVTGYTGSGTGSVAQEIVGKTINARLALGSGATTDSLTPQGYGWSLKPNAGQAYNSMFNPSISPITADFLGSYAIEFWFQSTNEAQGKRGILRVSNATTPNPAVIYDAATHSIFMFTGTNSTANATTAAMVPGNVNTWHHVVLGVLQDETGNVSEVQARIDGIDVAISKGTYNSDINFGPGGAAFFGLGNASGADLPDLQFDGRIDEVALYNFGPVLTADELDARMADLANHYSALPTATHSSWMLY